MRLWRAFGDAAFVLLFCSLVIGPAARVWPGLSRTIRWRRQVGIWFALMALVHGFLIIQGWARWDLQRFLGFEYVPQLDRLVRLEPGFGLANVIGVVALIWTVMLLVTSVDWALETLGGAAWKRLHQGAHLIFYLSAIHSVYFLFLHYTLSFHKRIPPSNWFRFPSLLMITIVLLLQSIAFIKMTRKKSAQGPRQ